ncbi:hypothetical protein FS749_010399 [Ceratobasidium sp. UAMH 11750]|nr:hypothetical protein FS749_010399 [Ceratobasidium sp. UAMH 11750]
MLTAASLGIPCILQSDIHVDEDAMAKGGYADVFRGDLTLNGKPSPIQVAVKKVRIRLYGEATRTLVEKKQQQLARELRIWNKLQRFSDPHPHLLALLGVIEAPGGLLDSVSEYCTGTLASVNVLVTENGVAKICDFGHSRYIDGCHQDQFSSSDASSNFQATMRYTCPEFFRAHKVKPTVFSDMWAFGCLALEILSQLQPYHTIESEFLVSGAITSGAAPSVKPEYPNAAGCLNDVLWGVVRKCWSYNPSLRPSSNVMLESIYDLMARGLINPSAATPERPSLLMEDELIQLPSGVKDFVNETSVLRKESISSDKMVDIWVHYDEHGERNMAGRARVQKYVVKVPCVTLDSSRSANHSLDNVSITLIRACE